MKAFNGKMIIFSRSSGGLCGFAASRSFPSGTIGCVVRSSHGHVLITAQRNVVVFGSMDRPGVFISFNTGRNLRGARMHTVRRSRSNCV